MKNVYSRSFESAPPPRNLCIERKRKKSIYFFNKTCYYSDIKHHNYCTGFTLAEVLITLGIIGIIAALTMPTLIANYQKKRTVTQLKATYSILNQAFEAAKADYGDMDNWDMDSYKGQTTGGKELFKSFTEKYFLPYIKPVKNYGITKFSNIGYEQIYYLNKNIDSNSLNSQKYIISLANGSIVGLSLDTHCDEIKEDSDGNKICTSGHYYTSIYIIVDINGIKKPNTIGKDIFVMSMYSNKFGFYRYPASENKRDILLQYCSKNSIENRHCGRLIQYDGWEIKYDW